MKISGFSPAELDNFRQYQRASYATLEAVAASLREGETEKQDVGCGRGFSPDAIAAGHCRG